MTFSGFMDFVRAYDGGELFSDPAYMGYDLLYALGDSRLDAALRRAGFRTDEQSVGLAECMTRVREGGIATVSAETLQRLLVEWYVWERINSGEVRSWPRRKA